MKEVQDIVAAYDEAQREGRQTALATVVHVLGSSYRRPGARMLVTDDGKLTGAISGGCLEGDALRKARLVMARQQALLATYDTTDEDDAKLGVGLGCNGIIQILIEPIDPANPLNPIQLLKTFLRHRQTAVLVTLFSLAHRKAEQPGTCFLMEQNGYIKGHALADKTLQAALEAQAKEALQTGASSFVAYDDGQQLTSFVEVLKPPVALVVVGAGNDAIPLVQLADVLGWEITVVDGRANYATAARFPLAKRVLVAKPELLLAHISPDNLTAFVLMTHNYNYDSAVLRQILPLQPPYIGSLGPKKKLGRMLEELEGEGVPVTEAQRQVLYGPTGLDIGSETSEEIALSIIAEIKAVFSRRSGAPLRDKPDVIHPRQDAVIRKASFSGQVDASAETG
ncbi:XdhC family protein [Pontibacter russatus]|uniref:XdhC family protein n=1 Tax=Pontibacter russatus TaxID=2694929 RepID=UPI00137A1575|nr:XdhC/CoxI family protein [Pontibacter russatus]